MFFLHAVQIPMHFCRFHLLVFELLGAVLISAVLPPILFFSFCCFLGMCAIHNSFFFFSTIFHKHSCIPFYVPFVFFPTLPLLFCQPAFSCFFSNLCLLNCLLVVKATQGLHHCQWLATQGCHSLIVAGYIGSPSITCG